MKFLSGTLRVLDRILQIRGSQVSMDEIDLSGSLSPVMDVSRLAQLASSRGGYGGFSSMTLTTNHGVAPDQQWTNADPYLSTLAAMKPWANPVDVWVWVMHVGLSIYPTLTLTEGQFGFVQIAVEAMAAHTFMTHRWTGQATQTLVSGGNLMGVGVPLNHENSHPFLVPRGADLRFASSAGGAIAPIQCQVTLWTGPFGVLPPGVA